MSNSEKYSPLFSEALNTILKIDIDYCKKNKVLEFLAKIFWLGCLSIFEIILFTKSLFNNQSSLHLQNI